MNSRYYIKPHSVGCHGTVYWAVYERRLWLDRQFGGGCLSKMDAQKALKEIQAHEQERLLGRSEDTQTQ